MKMLKDLLKGETLEPLWPAMAVMAGNGLEMAGCRLKMNFIFTNCTQSGSLYANSHQASPCFV